ncbi:Ataxin-3 [Actinomortierella wolfii]|nr:Ataxin-3 [Actinomortierella wolfii]
MDLQEGNLCAQHCLNALLQGPYFTAIELADLARQLDQRERDALDSHSRSGPPSQNMDDSGFFSVQVISEALAIWQLQIIPWGSQDVKDAKQHPEYEQAFILNLHEHWFTLRRFGPSTKRWYDLNSMHERPKPMSDTYLGMALSQLEAEKYSIFVVRPLYGPLTSPTVVHVDTSTTSSSTTNTVSAAASTSTPAPAPAVAPTTSAAANSFLAERREMERIRRQRIEELERQKNGGSGGQAHSSSSSTSTTTDKTRIDHAGNEQRLSPQSPKTVAVVKTPSYLPACEADRVALTLPYEQVLEGSGGNNLKKGGSAESSTKDEPFSGAGYRLGSSAGAKGADVLKQEEEDAMLAAALSEDPNNGRMDDVDEAEWEMMQQAIAMSLQK